jgi:hypothetical protein
VKISNSKAQVREALTKAGSGEAFDDAERDAADSVREAPSTREGLHAGDVVRASTKQPRLKLEENPTGSWGGPGLWKAKPESMTAPSAAFQESVTGVRAGGHSYFVGGVEFDGVRVGEHGNVVLLEAKGDYAQFLLNGVAKPFMNLEEKLIDKVERQARTSTELGLKLEVHCLQPEIAAILRAALFRYSSSVEVFPQGDP